MSSSTSSPTATPNVQPWNTLDVQVRKSDGFFETEHTNTGPQTKTTQFIASKGQDLFPAHSDLVGRGKGLALGVVGFAYGGAAAAGSAWATTFHGTSIVADTIRENKTLKNVAYVGSLGVVAASVYYWPNHKIAASALGLTFSSFFMSLCLSPKGGSKTSSLDRAMNSGKGVARGVRYAVGMPFIGLRSLVQPREALLKFHSLEKMLHGREGSEKLNTLSLRDVQQIISPLFQKFLFEGVGFSPSQMLGMGRVGGLADKVGTDKRFEILEQPKKKDQ